MRKEEGGGFRMGKRVCLWQIHFNIWQNQYNIVKFKNKIKKERKKKKVIFSSFKKKKKDLEVGGKIGRIKGKIHRVKKREQ